MATRSNRRSTRVSEVETAESTQSPLTPARATRLDEKHQLQSLNDRLASYIERVRQLENENQSLKITVQSSQETSTREVTEIKSVYDKELFEARKVLDETSKEKARLQIDANAKKAENDELKNKLSKVKKDLATAERKWNHLELQNQELQGKLSQAISDKNKLSDKLTNALDETNTLSDQIATSKRQLEEETLQRVDAENNIQSLKEQLSFRESVYQKELSESKLLSRTEVSELDNRLKDHYEEQMADNLRELRENYEDQMQMNRNELDLLYKSKIDDLTKTIDSMKKVSTTSRDEFHMYKSKAESLESQIKDLESQNTSLLNRIKDLERILEQERMWNKSALKEKEDELAKLRAEMANQLKEFEDLMDTKVAMSSELAVYRTLLEGEETRLNLSQSISGTPVRRGKRKRTTISEQQASNEDVASADGLVEISDQDNRFVKILNNGEEDVALGGWQIVRKSGEAISNFKFNRSTIAKPKSSITVWSADSQAIHAPPHDFVMKTTKWATGDEVNTALINNEGREVASRTTVKRFRMGSVHRSAEEEPRLDRAGTSPDRCSIM